jgi:hypothetical protein
MRRPLTALVFLVLAALLGANFAASAATPNDTTCRKLVTGSWNSEKVVKYDACRFDKLDSAVAGLAPGTAPTSNPTSAPTSPASPSVSPTPAVTTTSAPPSSGKPGSTNTGVPAGTTLTAYTGPKTITTAGTVIDGKDVNGALRIEAKNVTIKNSKVHGDLSSTGIYVTYNFEVGITYSNFTAIRVNLHDITFDGLKMSSNARLQDSWIHAPKPTADAHWDGVQVQNGVVNTVIQGNNIDASGSGTNSALFLCPDIGPSTAGPLTVTSNWLSGGNFTVAILDGNNGQYFIKSIIVRTNRFVTPGQYGFSNVNVPITQSGNVVDSSGAAYTL